MKNKGFECKKGECELELEILVYGCKKCIKKTGVKPTEEVKEAIVIKKQ